MNKQSCISLLSSIKEDYFTQFFNNSSEKPINSANHNKGKENNERFKEQKQSQSQESGSMAMEDEVKNKPNKGQEKREEKNFYYSEHANIEKSNIRSDSQKEYAMKSEIGGDTKPNTDDETPPQQQLNKVAAQTTSTLQEELKVNDEYHDLVMQSQQQTGKISKDDFHLLQVLGTGSYGKVLLVKKKDTEKLYAMKVLKKKQIKEKRQIKYTWTERKILESIQHPFIVKMNYAFQTDKKLFLVLDYCPGGELFFYISQIGRLNENSARFYAANVLLALECLHSNGIIYRDLKPENILLDDEGFAKLTDFGLSKQNIIGDNMAHSFCGTCEYLSPEILNKKPYGKQCDWWSFGCVLYEMLTGIPPFYSKKRDEMFNRIRFSNPTFYSIHSPEAVDLLSKLLRKDPNQRLGNNGTEEIKSHPFFKSIDWGQMMEKKCETPYKPLLESKDDTKHFDFEQTQKPVESPQYQMSGGCASNGENDDEFRGFSFEAQAMEAQQSHEFGI